MIAAGYRLRTGRLDVLAYAPAGGAGCGRAARAPGLVRDATGKAMRARRHRAAESIAIPAAKSADTKTMLAGVFANRPIRIRRLGGTAKRVKTGMNARTQLPIRRKGDRRNQLFDLMSYFFLNEPASARAALRFFVVRRAPSFFGPRCSGILSVRRVK